MQILRHYTDIPDALKRGVAVLGNFDGVHLGHQAVLAAGRAVAERSLARLWWR